MGEWKPLSRLAQEIGIPEASVRRYALEYFSDFIPVRRQGRTNLVNVDSVPVIKRASVLFADGQGREQVREALEREFGRVHEVEASGGAVANDSPAMPATFETNQAVAMLAEAFQALADNKREVDELRADNRQLRERLDRLEAHFSASKLPVNGSVEHPDAKAEPDTPAQPKIPWWKVWA